MLGETRGVFQEGALGEGYDLVDGEGIAKGEETFSFNSGSERQEV